MNCMALEQRCLRGVGFKIEVSVMDWVGFENRVGSLDPVLLFSSLYVLLFAPSVRSSCRT